MPLYEYQCRSCGKVTDVRHGFDEKNVEVCPECGGDLARRFSAAGIVFKGSGFYVTDSRKSSSTSSAKSPDGAKGDGAKSDAAKTETATTSESGGSTASSSDSSSSKGDTAAA